MQVEYTVTNKGFEVKVGKAHLPGYFLSEIMAKKAADRYIALINADKEARKKKSQTD